MQIVASWSLWNEHSGDAGEDIVVFGGKWKPGDCVIKWQSHCHFAPLLWLWGGLMMTAVPRSRRGLVEDVMTGASHHSEPSHPECSQCLFQAQMLNAEIWEKHRWGWTGYCNTELNVQKEEREEQKGPKERRKHDTHSSKSWFICKDSS